MYHNLYRYLKVPPAYTPSDAGIWTNKHISQQMLAAHLDPTYEGASRNHDFIDQSVAWIKQILPPAQYPNLLDVGCGPGLYAERFCREGCLEFSGSQPVTDTAAGWRNPNNRCSRRCYCTQAFYRGRRDCVCRFASHFTQASCHHCTGTLLDP